MFHIIAECHGNLEIAPLGKIAIALCWIVKQLVRSEADPKPFQNVFDTAAQFIYRVTASKKSQATRNRNVRNSGVGDR